MKIVSFNINGLNAFDNKGNLERLISETDADIYCFQETKISAAKEERMKEIYSKFPCYKAYNAICIVKNGYAGVSTLVHDRVKDRLKLIDTTINVLQYDEEYAKFGNGRVVMLEFDNFYLVNTYVVNSGGKSVARIKFDIRMRQYLSWLSSMKPVIYCGDLNVCGTELDYWGNFERSKNTAPGLFEFEINAFSKLINECNMVDTYRYTNGDKKEYTWFSPMGSKYTDSACKLRKGWRIDYFLVSDELKDKVRYSKIYEGWNEKDHSPIELEIDV